MKTYNVKEIATITDTNEETVRRWIRSGKLTSQGISTISGNIIAETDLIDFFQKTPKYLTAVTKKVSKIIKANPTEAVAYATLGAVGGGLAILLAKTIETALTPDEKEIAMQTVKSDIKQTENSIKSKQEQIEKLKAELEAEQNHLANLKIQIKEK